MRYAKGWKVVSNTCSLLDNVVKSVLY